MENMADALKMVLGILVFVLGLTMFFIMVPRARDAAETIITEIDKTKYYEYQRYTDGAAVDTWGNRRVKLDDFIPAIYRYSEENYGVTIISNKEIVARFDLDTERACNNWITASDYNKYQFINETNTKLLDRIIRLAGYDAVDLIEVNATNTNDSIYCRITSEKMSDLFRKLYHQEASITSNIRRDPYCHWVGTMGWTAQRIDSDLSRCYSTI